MLVGALKSPDVTRLSHFLERNAIPFRVVDPDEDRDASSLLARFAPKPGELPIVVLPDGTVLKNPTKHELARALGLVAASFRSEPYDVAIVGAGPAGLATAVYGASEGLSIVVLEALAFGGQAGASARIENYLGFPTGVSGQALMGRAFTQAQKFGAEFSLSTEVKRLDCTSERSGPDPDAHPRARRWPARPGARGRRSPPARAIAVRRFRTSRSSRAAASRTGPRRSRPGCAATRTWPCWVEELGGPGRGVPGQPRASRARAGARARPLEHDVALPHRSDRGLSEHRGALRDRGRRAPRHARPGSAGRALAQPAHRGRGTARHRPPVPLHRRRSGGGLAHRLRHPLDEKGFIRTGADVRSTERAPLPLETGIEGIFAVGDVRCGSVKRVGAAIGEGPRSSRSCTPSSPGGGLEPPTRRPFLFRSVRA